MSPVGMLRRPGVEVGGVHGDGRLLGDPRLHRLRRRVPPEHRRRRNPMRKHNLILPAAAAATALALAAPVGSNAASIKSLRAVVGPGFTIGVYAGSHKATINQPGRYRITVHDNSNIHNFHLIGPGVNKKTGVAFKGTVVWTLTLRTGSYRYVCDPHASIMKGKFTISNL
jgi:plastocyanin